MTKYVIPERVIPGMRLGRNINHDPRSLRYLVPEAPRQGTSAKWTRVTPVLDQGNLGSCTGNAIMGLLGTGPFYASLKDQVTAGTLHLDEPEAVALYSLATKLDPYAGTYPPDDTGSDGLSVCKAAQQRGLINGYQHATSVAAAMTAILSGPFIVGTDWLSGMDAPDSNGQVKVTGTVRGGHEYECVGYNATADLWEFVNSWGSGWGAAGRFYYRSADLAKLLGNGGDITVPVPITAPAPTPTPVPTPGQGLTVTFQDPEAAALNAWADKPHVWSLATKAAHAWKAAIGRTP